MDMRSYITGFVDGEGSFLVSFNKRSRLSVGVETRPSFSVSQHMRNNAVIHDLHRYFDCGSVRFSKRDSNYKFEVRSLNDLLEKVIPHFHKHQLQTSKKNDFALFVEICSLMKQGEHLAPRGIQRIVHLAYQMNNLGSRRYTEKDILRFISKVKV